MNARAALALGTLMLLWTGPVHSAPCVPTRADRQHVIGEGNFASPSTRGARADKPAVYHFRTAQSVIVEFRGANAQEFEGSGRLVVSYRTGTERFKVFCDTGVLSGKALRANWVNEYRINLGKAGPVDWQLQVFDYADGGPTDDEPYLLGLTIRTLDGKLTQNDVTREDYKPKYFDRKPRASPSTVPACGTVTRPIPPQGHFQTLVKKELPVLGDRVPTVIAIEAGRNVYLRASDPKQRGAKIHAIVSGKISDHGIFYPQCHLTVTPPARPAAYAFASVEWERFSLVNWRIEAFVSGENRGPVALEVVVDRDPLRRSFNLPDSIPPSAQFLCQANAKFSRVSRTGQSSAFAVSSGLAIGLSDPDRLLNARARDWLTKQILASLVTWRQACQDCNPFNMSAVKVDDRIFMLGHLADWLRKGQPRPAPPGPYRIPQVGERYEPSERDVSGLLRNRAGMRGTPNAYIEIAPNDPALRNLCDTPRDKLPKSIEDAWLALGCAKNDPPPLTLLFRNARTTCGNDPNVVACEVDRMLIELNGADYTFMMGADRAGRGSRFIDGGVVLGHETGHWIWLGHVESDESLMSESLQTARCIDDATVQSLNAVARGELTTQPRRSALYFESPKR